MSPAQRELVVEKLLSAGELPLVARAKGYIDVAEELPPCPLKSQLFRMARQLAEVERQQIEILGDLLDQWGAAHPEIQRSPT